MSGSKLPNSIAAMLAGLVGGGVTFLTVEPREGESVEDAIARTEAEHRETCQGCAEAYEAEQFEAKKKAHDAELNEARKAVATDGDTDIDIVTEQRRKLYAHQEAERDALARKQKAEEAQFLKGQKATERYEGKRPELGATYGEGSNSANPTRQPIGYMAFHVLPDGTAKAIPPSFNEDRNKVEEAMNEVEQHPIAQLLTSISGTSTEVRPVFGE